MGNLKLTLDILELVMSGGDHFFFKEKVFFYEFEKSWSK